MKDQRRQAGDGRGAVAGLQFEQWPHVALVSTYCADHAVADSACSATAYMTGIKGNKARQHI